MRVSSENTSSLVVVDVLWWWEEEGEEAVAAPDTSSHSGTTVDGYVPIVAVNTASSSHRNPAFHEAESQRGMCRSRSRDREKSSIQVRSSQVRSV